MLVFLFAEGGFEVNADDAAKVLTPDAIRVLQAARGRAGRGGAVDSSAIHAALTAALVDPAGLGLEPGWRLLGQFGGRDRPPRLPAAV